MHDDVVNSRWMRGALRTRDRSLPAASSVFRGRCTQSPRACSYERIPHEKMPSCRWILVVDRAIYEGAVGLSTISGLVPHCSDCTERKLNQGKMQHNMAPWR
jgi:hypothetical protein